LKRKYFGFEGHLISYALFFEFWRIPLGRAIRYNLFFAFLSLRFSTDKKKDFRCYPLRMVFEKNLQANLCLLIKKDVS
jgi:hypothetical protein